MNEDSKYTIDPEATQIIDMTNTVVMHKVGLSEDELKQKVTQPDWSNLQKSFTNLSVVGIGGMGTVFSAKDTIFYRNLALKIMRSDLRNNPESIQAFIREARITAQIDHPNVVPVYNLGVFDGTGAYFSMKRVEGETLSYVLKKLNDNDEAYQKKYSLRRRLEIFISICNGVSFAHSKGVIHRDLKPANIMLGNYGEVFIMDWGMSAYIEQNDSSSKGRKIDLREEQVEQKKNVISGTPLFMSPEQICGCELEHGEQSDVYSLGTILYCILSCKQSIIDPTLDTEVLLNKVLKGEVIPPRKRAKNLRISKELEAICLKAIEVERDYRYKNVTELMHDIKNVLDMQVVGVYNSPFIRSIKFCRRHPMIPTAFIVASLTMAVFFSYFFISDTLEFKGLQKLIEINIEECEQLYAKQKQLYMKHNANNAKSDMDYILLTSNNRNDLIINDAKFYDSSSQLLEALEKISNLTYKPDISLTKKQILNLVILYNLNATSSGNLSRIIRRVNEDLAQDLRKIIQADSEFAVKVNLMEKESGKLNMKSDTPITMSVNYQSNNALGENSSRQIMIAPFEKELNNGTYIFNFKNQDADTVSLPIKIETGKILNYNLSVPDKIPSGTVFIPAGEYFSGINNISDIGYKRFIEDFFIKKNEVTFGEYLEFWHTLTDPKLKKNYTAHKVDNQDTLELTPLWDASGSLIAPFNSNMPVIGLSINAIEAYCEYLSKKLNMKCRLPFFGEIEKSARGIDERIYVWGNGFKEDYALLNRNPKRSQYPNGAPAGTFPKDCSVYGVNDLAGNLREVIKINGENTYGTYGGSFLTDRFSSKCSNINRFIGIANDLGFRYVIEPNKDKK